MASWPLAKKELRLLIRDRKSFMLLLVMPLLFILVLGLLLGDTFGQTADDRTRIVILNLDRGQGLKPGETWGKAIEDDLRETAGIRLEYVDSEAEAGELIENHKQAAILVLKPTFGDKVSNCSFLVDGINPFHRDGVDLEKIDAAILKDPKSRGQSAVIEQVAQISLLRVILPYMIGRAFERLSEPEFIEMLGKAVSLPVPELWRPLVGQEKMTLQDFLQLAAFDRDKSKAAAKATDYRSKVGEGVQSALRQQFQKYNLTGKTWATLTKAQGIREGEGGDLRRHVNKDGSGFLHRGAYRYQLLVPSYTVMFAFFLVMTVGWLFVTERREGTLKRLRAAPITRGQILLGKLIPCFILSLSQGIFLMVAGRLFFGMRWGPEDWTLGHQLLWLLPVIMATSLAAMGLALLVAAVARTEMQVALYGAIPVLILALIGGCVLPKEMMPEETQRVTLLSPHGWALAAYGELLDPDPHYQPNTRIIWQSDLVLAGFGVVFLGLSWWCLRLD